MLAKVGDPLCLKTEVGGKQGHALRKKQSSKHYLIKEFVKELAPSLQLLLAGGEFEVRFGSWNIKNFCGKSTEVGEQLRRREVDMCCLQKVRWRRQEDRLVGCRGRRYRLWWSGNNDEIEGVGNLVKKELRKKVVEVQKKQQSDGNGAGF